MHLRAHLIATPTHDRVRLEILFCYAQALFARREVERAEQAWSQYLTLWAEIHGRPMPAVAATLTPVNDLGAVGLFITGGSGAGKTFSVRTAVRTAADLFPDYRVPGSSCPIVSIDVPPGCTFRTLGVQVCDAFGYAIRNRATDHDVWARAYDLLKAHDTVLIHFDEAARIRRSKSDNEIVWIRDKLTALTDHDQTPFGIILSGLPEGLSLLERDPQIRRRFRALVSVPELSQSDIEVELPGIIALYAELAEIAVDIPFASDFVYRHAHVCGRMLGIAIDLIIEAIGIAVMSADGTLRIAHFAEVVQRASGWPSDRNPYLCADWLSIDCSKFLDREDPPPPPRPRKR